MLDSNRGEQSYEGTPLNLSCVTEINTVIVNIPFIVNITWSQPIVSHGMIHDTVNYSEEGLTVYSRNITFHSLNFEDIGNYTCTLTISSLENSVTLPSTKQTVYPISLGPLAY